MIDISTGKTESQINAAIWVQFSPSLRAVRIGIWLRPRRTTWFTRRDAKHYWWPVGSWKFNIWRFSVEHRPGRVKP
ncbi:MAG: hypothetical protein WC455_29885 [Dehalococcoidia bacterium]